MANIKYVYYGASERFGYELQCIGLTEEEVRESLINEYVRVYTQRNGSNPKEAYEWVQENQDNEDMDDYDEYSEDAEYYETFIDELFIEKRELGVVEWR